MTTATAMTIEPRVWHDDSVPAHWRSLLAAIAPGVAAAMLGQGLLTVSAGVVVLDGGYVTKMGWQQYVALPLWLAAWTLSISAAMLVIRGALIGSPVSAGFALRAGVRRWGWVAGVLVVQALLTGVLFFVASLTAAFLGPIALVAIFFAFFIPAATIAALPIAVLDGMTTIAAVGRAWELSTGKRWRMFWFFVVVAVPGAAVGWLADLLAQWRPGLLWTVFFQLVLAAATVVVIGFQATVLTRWRLRQDAPDVQRFPAAAARPDQWRLGAGLIAGAVFAIGAVTLANPSGVPVLASESAFTGDFGPAVTANGHLTAVKGNSAALAWVGGGAILPDGRTLFASHNNSGPQVHIEICGKESFCDTKLLTTLDRPGLAWLSSAAMATGAGLVVVAVTQETGMRGDQAELVLWRCPTATCESSQRQVVAAKFSSPGLGNPGILLAVGQDTQGQPVIALSDHGFASQYADPPDQGVHSVTVFRCPDADCTTPAQEHPNLATLVDGDWLAQVSGVSFDGQGRLVAAVVGPPAREPQRSGLNIQIGRTRPAAMPVASVVCLDDGCQARDQRRWHDVDPDTWYSNSMIQPIVLPDGSIVLAELARFAGGGRLIRCQSHCD